MTSRIHPTAVLEKGAEIGEDCVIGPYCYVGKHVRLGTGVILHPHAVVWGCTTVGAGCEIFPFACIGSRTQDLKYQGGDSYVEIGAHTTLREYVTVHAATAAGDKTIVGSHCTILAYCHIAHDCQIGDYVIMSNNSQLAGHVTVEDHVVFGGMCGVHQFVRIGRMAMISGMAAVRQDIAPFCLAAGDPAAAVTVNRVGMQRNGLSPEVIRAIGRAYRILFREGLQLEEALRRLRTEFADVPEVQHMADFAEASERGLARPKGQDES